MTEIAIAQTQPTASGQTQPKIAPGQSVTAKGETMPTPPQNNPSAVQGMNPVDPATTSQATKNARILRQQQAAIRNLSAQLGGSVMDRIFKDVFIANITGVGADGSLYTWQELTNEGGFLVNFGGGRKCTDATDASAAQEINGWLWIPNDTWVVMVEIEDVDHFRYQFAVVIEPPPLQDGSTSYVLGYDKDSQATVWLEQATCDDSFSSDYGVWP